MRNLGMGNHVGSLWHFLCTAAPRRRVHTPKTHSQSCPCSEKNPNVPLFPRETSERVLYFFEKGHCSPSSYSIMAVWQFMWSGAMQAQGQKSSHCGGTWRHLFGIPRKYEPSHCPGTKMVSTPIGCLRAQS